MSKNTKSKSDTWSHHDTMISNLRDWVNREINLFLSNPDVKNQLEADSIAVPINTVSEFQELVCS